MQRQHTVPKFLLRNFANPKDQLLSYDRSKGSNATLSVRDASVEAGIYTLTMEHGRKSDIVENEVLARVDDQASVCVRRILSGEGIPPSAEDRESLALFIAMQMTRTRRFRDEFKEMVDWSAKAMVEGLDREGVAAQLRRDGAEPTDEAIDEVVDLVGQPDRYRIEAHPNEAIQIALDVALKLFPLLLTGWNWVCVRNGKRSFVISDHPIALIGDQPPGDPASGLGLLTASEVWLPLSPTCALVLSRDFALPAAILNIPRHHVKLVNTRMALGSMRWTFWHPKHRPLDGVAIPPLLRSQTIGTVDSAYSHDGSLGELIRLSSERPRLRGEQLLSGRRVSQ